MDRPGPTKLTRRFGARLRRLREAAGLTQEQLAWELDFSKGFLSMVEAGKRVPSLPVLDEIAKHLKLDLVDLFVLDPEHPRGRLLDAVRRKDRKAAFEALRELGLR